MTRPGRSRPRQYLGNSSWTMSRSIPVETCFGHRTYMLTSATGSGARCAWHHAVSQTGPSNFHQHVRSDDYVKGQYVSFPFSEPVERAEFHEIHADVDSVVSKNLVE